MEYLFVLEKAEWKAVRQRLNLTNLKLFFLWLSLRCNKLLKMESLNMGLKVDGLVVTVRTLLLEIFFGVYSFYVNTEILKICSL